MSVMREFPGNELQQRIFHVSRRFPRRDPRSIRDAEDVCVDRYCRLSENCVEDDVRSFASHSRQSFERLARARHFATVVRRRLTTPWRSRSSPWPSTARWCGCISPVPRRRDPRSRAACARRGTAYGLPHSRSCRWPARTGSPPPAIRTASGTRAPWSDADWRRGIVRRSRGALLDSWGRIHPARAPRFLSARIAARSAARRALRSLCAS